MKKITPKPCLYCKNPIPTTRPAWWSRPLTASHYARLKYCSLKCSCSMRNKTETKWGRKTKKPDIEILNRLWSKTHSYKKMAKELGVSYSAIKKWMGLQKYLTHPELTYAGEPGHLIAPVKKDTRKRGDYYKKYYNENVKPNQVLMEKRRERMRKHKKASKEFSQELQKILGLN